MLTDLLLVRHGEAYNTAPVDGLREIRDRANPPLTPLGERQARELVTVLSEFMPEAIVVSPFLRAVQTAWPYVSETTGAAPATAIPVHVDRRFCEILADPVFSGFRGLDIADYRARFGPRVALNPALGDRAAFPAYPEPPDSVRTRVTALWNELVASPTTPARVAFIGHGASLSALLTSLVPEYTADIGHVNCGATHLRRTGPAAAPWSALYVNRKDHLTRFGAAAALVSQS
ncbi:hypothetical protein OPIT5_14455 [Opitutaceae bacterium TAV5]|nr:hypothetical protein OPIT5_14455 [Opitutaceae bacterium TAV5]